MDDLVQTYNEEQEDKTLWDIWLHRIYDKSYPDWKNSLTGKTEKAAPTQEEVKSIAMDSRNILAGFVPDEGVNRSGTVQAAGNDSG